MDGFDQLVQFSFDAMEQVKRHGNGKADFSDKWVPRVHDFSSFILFCPTNKTETPTVPERTIGVFSRLLVGDGYVVLRGIDGLIDFDFFDGLFHNAGAVFFDEVATA